MWAVELDGLEVANTTRKARLSKPEHVVDIILRQNSLAQECLSTTEDCPPGVVHVIPAWQNERLSVQQGSFLFPFRLDVSFERNLASTLEIEWNLFEQQLNESEAVPEK